MALMRTFASPVHGGGVTRRRAGDGGGGNRTGEPRPFHHSLFTPFGERSPALRGRR
jgi:hypothetical protein